MVQWPLPLLCAIVNITDFLHRTPKSKPICFGTHFSLFVVQLSKRFTRFR